jgi:hypothetical protein
MYMCIVFCNQSVSRIKTVMDASPTGLESVPVDTVTVQTTVIWLDCEHNWEMGVVLKKGRHTGGAAPMLTVQYLIPQFKRRTTAKNKIINPESKWRAAILKLTKDDPWTGLVSSLNVIHVSGIIYFVLAL